MKLNLPIAAKNGQKMRFNNTHLSTTDFFRPFVNYYLETVPKDKINATIKQFVQGYPLAGANLGQFTHSMYSFHVPFRVVWSDFNDWIMHNETTYYVADSGGSYKTQFLNKPILTTGYRPYAPIVSVNDLFYLVTGLEPFKFMGEQAFLRLSPFDTNEAFLYTTYEITQDEYETLFNWVTDIDHITNFAEGTNIQTSTAPSRGVNIKNYWVCRETNISEKIYNQLVNKFDEVFKVHESTCNINYFVGVNYTNYGRYFRQLIESVGYTFGGDYILVTDMDDRNYGVYSDYSYEDENSTDSNVIRYLSALPLMCIVKCFIDYFVPTKFKHKYDLQLKELGKYQFPFRPISNGVVDTPASTPMPFSSLSELLLFSTYKDDYFTNAFLYPNGSNSNENIGVEFDDITQIDIDTNGRSIVGTDNYGIKTPMAQLSEYYGGDFGSASIFTSYTLRALNALNNFVRRNQIVGYKTIDRYLARYGVKLDETQANRCVLISSDVKDIVPLNVMNSADSFDGDVASPESQQALLGGRASNLIFGHELKAEYDTAKEFGFFFVISVFAPKIGYVDGLDRNMLHTTYDSFYQPEFDSLGVQPILRGELYNRNSYSVRQNSAIFGYAPRYAEYKVKLDKLSGDFLFNSRNAFLDSLHTFRRGSDIIQAKSINNQFLIGSNSDYDRIFVMDTDEYDHLQTASYNDVTVIRHTDSYSDVKDINDGHSTMSTSIGGNNILH